MVRKELRLVPEVKKAILIVQGQPKLKEIGRAILIVQTDFLGKNGVVVAASQ
jgi:hypothetical protein